MMVWLVFIINNFIAKSPEFLLGKYNFNIPFSYESSYEEVIMIINQLKLSYNSFKYRYGRIMLLYYYYTKINKLYEKYRF